MNWEVCIQYPNGRKQPLHRYVRRESALRCIDLLYDRYGYPLHTAYVVCQVVDQSIATLTKVNPIPANCD